MSKENQNHLLYLINTLWSTGCVPETWRKSIVIPIPKANQDPQAVEGYRPINISLICFV